MSTATYYRAHRMYHDGWAVVHSLPGHGALPTSQRAVAVDVDGFADMAAAEKEAAWMNAERERAQQRAADEQRLCGLRWGPA